MAELLAQLLHVHPVCCTRAVSKFKFFARVTKCAAVACTRQFCLTPVVFVIAERERWQPQQAVPRRRPVLVATKSCCSLTRRSCQSRRCISSAKSYAARGATRALTA